MIDLDAVRRAVDADAPARGNVRCPIHDDGNPSLSIDMGAAGIIVRCHADCDQDAVFAEVRRRAGHLLDHNRPAKPRETIYEYLGADGTPLARVIRKDTPRGKDIWQQTPDGRGGWQSGGLKAAKPLYRLDALAKRPDATVVITEGEKACEAAQRQLGDDYVCVSWMGGVGAVDWADLEPLRDREVVVWPDADDPGKKAAARLVERLRRIARDIRLVRVDDLPAKADAADTQWTVEDFLGRLMVPGAPPVADVAHVAAPAHKGETGAQLLDAVLAYLSRFVAYPAPDAAIAHALWIVHTHGMDAWDSTPRIAFVSPEPGSGKSRALEVTELLVPNPVNAVNVSVAYMFRKVGDERGRPTILYDEVDTVFTSKGDNEDIRGLLNAGHRKHSVVGRCVVYGKRIETEETPAYCAVALAGLGDMPDTILTRSIVVRMRRRAPTEQVEPYRRRDVEAEADVLREHIAAWVAGISDQLANARPQFPDGVADRDADVWEALLAIADAAGGDWPTRAHVAAVALVADSKRSRPSLGVRLLADVRTAFGDADAMPTDAILKALHAMEEAPWSDLRGKPIDSRALAHRLKPYGIQSKNLRDARAVFRGYERADLLDAWNRYLSPIGSATSATSATSAQL